MGSDESKPVVPAKVPENPELYIRIDKNMYSQGETVKGTVYFNVPFNFPSRVLNLEFTGEEGFKVFEGQALRHQDTFQAISTRHPLRSWQGTEIPKGQYEMPFCLDLPENLPDSFEFMAPGQLEAEISYKVTAYVISSTPETQPGLRHEAHFIVKRKPPQTFQPLVTKESIPVKYCWCMNGGASEISYTMEKDAYAPGETAYLIVLVDNSTCRRGIEFVDITVKKVVRINGKDDFNLHSDEVIKKERLEPIAALQGITDASKKLVEIKLALNPTSKKVATTTTKGEHINCTFVVESIVKYVGNFAAPVNHRFEFPVYEPEFSLTNKMLAPPVDWKPEKMETTQIPLQASPTLKSTIFAEHAPVLLQGGEMAAPPMLSPGRKSQRQSNATGLYPRI